MLRKLRNWILAGVVVLLPIWLTIFTIVWLFDYVDRAVTAPIKNYFKLYIPGLGVLIAIALFLLVGWLTTHLLGQQVLRMGEKLMRRIPLVRGLYSAVKQMTDAVFSTREQPFSKVVLVEYPRRGIFSLGFLVGELPGSNMLRIWIPPGPSPTAGPIVLFPATDVMQLPMAVEDGFKMIVSAGAFTPKEADLLAISEAVSELQRRSST